MTKRALFLFTLVAAVFAQSDRGVITGTVTDTTGGAVPGAGVVAIHVATNVEYPTTATGTGDFTLPALPAGVYRVRVTHSGFKTAIRDNAPTR